MPRRPRIEYKGALYHVLCRGDRREAIFLTDEDRELFLETLGQACERTGWSVHSYVLMDNHYHLLLETPQGGLVEGMRWFQTTYTARFNARHRMSGHLFQGRYKALVLDPEDPSYFRTVSDYIHLNPARAKLLKGVSPRLEEYRWSSYPSLIGKSRRPTWLETHRVLEVHRATRRGYEKYVRERVQAVLQDDPALMTEWKSVRRGWFLGSEAFREKLLGHVGERMAHKKRESYSGEEVQGHDEKTALELLEKGLRQLRISLDELKELKTTDSRKQALVWLIRSSTLVSSDWISRNLGMGHRSNISRAVRRFQAEPRGEAENLKKKMLRCKD